ncbi:cephalosporin hydroxylase [Fragilaria crotonensis]|nr:cephalosporin hydroxylase [Fragilaria crotonensis]
MKVAQRGRGGVVARATPIKSLLTFVAGAACMHLWNGGALICPPEGQALERVLETETELESSVEELKSSVEELDASGDPELDFYSLGLKTYTDKVAAISHEGCYKNSKRTRARAGCKNERCRPWGHYYQTMYQSRLGKYSKASAEPFQFLEIGFFQGAGAETYRNFLPNGEVHSMEIACLPEGPREEGKWPWGNFAAKHRDYQKLLDANRLHCGDATNVTWLNEVWTKEMRREDAPPLKIVVDDGAHLAAHMAQSVFYWFPRIQPRGLMIVEDVQPIQEANWFRTRFLPKMMIDLHYCGDPQQEKDELFFPTLHPLLASIHCEMHICVFERNDEPAIELSLEMSTLPKDTFDDKRLVGSWGHGDLG